MTRKEPLHGKERAFPLTVYCGFDPSARSLQALGCFTHWFLCTLISWTFPMAAERAGSWTFAFFAAMMACQLVWAVFFMPETKGGTIEDIEKRLGLEA